MSEILTENTELCALCLKETTRTYSDLDTGKYRTQMSAIVPEFDISIIKSPVICSACSDSLNNAYTFKCNCLEVQKQIKLVSKNGKQIKLRNLFNKLEKHKKGGVTNRIVDKDEASCDDDNGNGSDESQENSEQYLEDFSQDRDDLIKVEESVVNIEKPAKVCDWKTKSSTESNEDVIMIKDDDVKVKKKRRTFIQVKREPKHYCAICKEEFLYHSTYKQHISEFHKQTISLSEKKNYLCSICGITTTTKTSLLYHHRTHTGERPHKCPYCDKSFAQMGSCTMHIKCIHSKERPYVCDICGKTFAWKRSYDGHILVVHDKEEKKHVCTSCGAAFHFSHKLKEHMRFHTGARDYKCKVCERAFSQSVYLKRHMSVHTGEKRYACPLCSKRFSLSYNRTIHVRSCSRKFKPEVKTDAAV